MELLAEARGRLADALPDLRVEHAELLVGGEANRTVRVGTRDGQDLVLRWGARPTWHPSVAGRVAALHLAGTLGVPVPDVVHASDALLVLRYVPGTPLTSPSRRVARDAGRRFGLLHAHAGTGAGPVGADGASPGWTERAYLEPMAAEAERLLREAVPGFDPPVVAAAVDLVEHQRVPLRCRLVHGDASPDNVLVDDEGTIVAVLDFDTAWYADPAVDLAWWWWGDEATAEAFASGCAEVSEPTDPLVVLLHRLRILVWLGDAFGRTDRRRRNRTARLLGETLDAARRLTG